MERSEIKLNNFAYFNSKLRSKYFGNTKKINDFWEDFLENPITSNEFLKSREVIEALRAYLFVNEINELSVYDFFIKNNPEALMNALRLGVYDYINNHEHLQWKNIREKTQNDESWDDFWKLIDIHVNKYNELENITKSNEKEINVESIYHALTYSSFVYQSQILGSSEIANAHNFGKDIYSQILVYAISVFLTEYITNVDAEKINQNMKYYAEKEFIAIFKYQFGDKFNRFSNSQIEKVFKGTLFEKIELYCNYKISKCTKNVLANNDHNFEVVHKYIMSLFYLKSYEYDDLASFQYDEKLDYEISEKEVKFKCDVSRDNKVNTKRLLWNRFVGEEYSEEINKFCESKIFGREENSFLNEQVFRESFLNLVELTDFIGVNESYDINGSPVKLHDVLHQNRLLITMFQLSYQKLWKDLISIKSFSEAISEFRNIRENNYKDSNFVVCKGLDDLSKANNSNSACFEILSTDIENVKDDDNSKINLWYTPFIKCGEMTFSFPFIHANINERLAVHNLLKRKYINPVEKKETADTFEKIIAQAFRSTEWMKGINDKLVCGNKYKVDEKIAGEVDVAILLDSKNLLLIEAKSTFELISLDEIYKFSQTLSHAGMQLNKTKDYLLNNKDLLLEWFPNEDIELEELSINTLIVSNSYEFDDESFLGNKKISLLQLILTLSGGYGISMTINKLNVFIKLAKENGVEVDEKILNIDFEKLDLVDLESGEEIESLKSFLKECHENPEIMQQFHNICDLYRGDYSTEQFLKILYSQDVWDTVLEYEPGSSVDVVDSKLEY